MQNEQSDEASQALDDATRRRLAQLAAVPVDTSRLERRLRAAMDAVAPQPVQPWRLRYLPRWSGAAVAAVLALALVLFSVFGWSSPAVASAEPLFDLHSQMTSGALDVRAADDLDQVRQFLHSNTATVPSLSELPPAVAAACCIHRVGDSRLLGVLVTVEGRPLSVVIGESHEVKVGDSTSVIGRGGREIAVHERDGMTMAMTHDDRRVVCVIGSAPAAELVQVLDRLVTGGRP